MDSDTDTRANVDHAQRLRNLHTWLICCQYGNAAQPAPGTVQGWIDALAASPTPLASGVPDGWVMVPREPTAAMMLAFNAGERYGFKTFGDRYAAMIAAAPPAPTPGTLPDEVARLRASNAALLDQMHHFAHCDMKLWCESMRSDEQFKSWVQSRARRMLEDHQPAIDSAAQEAKP